MHLAVSKNTRVFLKNSCDVGLLTHLQWKIKGEINEGFVMDRGGKPFSWFNHESEVGVNFIELAEYQTFGTSQGVQPET